MSWEDLEREYYRVYRRAMDEAALANVKVDQKKVRKAAWEAVIVMIEGAREPQAD